LLSDFFITLRLEADLFWPISFLTSFGFGESFLADFFSAFVDDVFEIDLVLDGLVSLRTLLDF
jgi:hypothetical protein